MNMSDVLGFWAVSVVFVIAPGSDWAYAISAGLRGRVAIPAVGGMLAGHLAATLLVAAGVGALVAGAPGLLGGLTLVGGAYLLWLGFMTFDGRRRPSSSTPQSRPARDGCGRGSGSAASTRRCSC